MKSVDVVSPVMRRITSDEKKRIRTFYQWFFGALFAVSGLVIISLLVVTRTVSERGTLELFSLFAEDFEVITQFWQDTVMTVWEELPERWVIGLLMLIALGIILWMTTRRRRRILDTKRRELEKYDQKG